MNLLRRGFLKGLSVFPAGLGVGLSPTQQTGDTKNDAAPLEVAIDVVRLFNTIELHCFLKRNVYAARDELLRIIEAAWFVDPRKAPKRTPAKRVYSYLRLNEEEIIAGWRMKLRTSESEPGYTVSLIATSNLDTPKTLNTICLSDEIGVIYLGDSDLNYDPGLDTRKPASILGLEPIDVKLARSGFFPSMMRKFAFATQGAPPPGGCSCACNCGTNGQCYCYNLGCRTCHWCCSGGCTDCILCTGHGCACCQP